jgi:N-methylhydantoinase B
VVDIIFGALSEAAPDRVVAASNGATTAIIFSGTEAFSGLDFSYVEALGGGMGASEKMDGADGVQVHITNTSNLPIESMEMEYPLSVQRYQLVQDSGGPGKYRGGQALRKDIKTRAPVLFLSHSDRFRVPPWGLFGGSPGSCGSFILNKGTPHERRLPSKNKSIILEPGDVLNAQTAGGGGIGSPLERDPVSVIRDVQLGKVSRRQALSSYGVVVTKDNRIDENKTTETRKRRKKNSKK